MKTADKILKNCLSDKWSKNKEKNVHSGKYCPNCNVKVPINTQQCPECDYWFVKG